MEPTRLPRCLIPLMYGRALVMRCRAMLKISPVGSLLSLADWSIRECIACPRGRTGRGTVSRQPRRAGGGLGQLMGFRRHRPQYGYDAINSVKFKGSESCLLHQLGQPVNLHRPFTIGREFLDSVILG